ncbi:hypothetical protein BH11MYX4_BH11MYX4_18280 [soil metagenome]
MWTALKEAALAAREVVVPTTVLAQVWRGQPSQARLAQALTFCVAGPFDRHARAVGELCARAKTADICDAHVVVLVRAGDVVYTSDPKDIRALLVAARRTAVVLVC